MTLATALAMLRAKADLAEVVFARRAVHFGGLVYVRQTLVHPDAADPASAARTFTFDAEAFGSLMVSFIVLLYVGGQRVFRRIL
jgi:hypothetical protein